MAVDVRPELSVSKRHWFLNSGKVLHLPAVYFIFLVSQVHFNPPHKIVTRMQRVKGWRLWLLCKLLSEKEVHYKMLSSEVWRAAKPSFFFFATAEGFLSFPPVGLSTV